MVIDAAFVALLGNMERFYTPGGAPLAGGDGAALTATLKPEQLITATIEFGKVKNAAQRFQPPGTDPFVHCLVCAAPNRTRLDDGQCSRHTSCSLLWRPRRATFYPLACWWFIAAGTPVPHDYPVTVSTDAINSANLFASSAGAGSCIEHTTDTYLSDAASRVRTSHSSGALRNEAAARADAADERAAEVQRAAEEARRLGEGGTQRYAAQACTTALSCNRETTNNAGRGEMWITGMVAAACMHVVPGLRLAIAMFGPEEHYYYDELLRDAFKDRPDLAAVYLDLACRYKHRFQGLMEQLQRDEVVANADAVKLLLPWMHAFDHDLQCQLKHSGMYTVS